MEAKSDDFHNDILCNKLHRFDHLLLSYKLDQGCFDTSRYYLYFENYLHWIFCYIYLKQEIEVKYLLENRIYAAK